MEIPERISDLTREELERKYLIESKMNKENFYKAAVAEECLKDLNRYIQRQPNKQLEFGTYIPKIAKKNIFEIIDKYRILLKKVLKELGDEDNE